jgi:hypothetical protein
MRMLVFIALALTGPAFARNHGEGDRQVAFLERQLGELRNSHNLLRRISPGSPVDVRGRRELQDMEQWVYSGDFEDRMRVLLKRARDEMPKQPNRLSKRCARC